MKIFIPPLTKVQSDKLLDFLFHIGGNKFQYEYWCGTGKDKESSTDFKKKISLYKDSIKTDKYNFNQKLIKFLKKIFY